MQCGIGLMHPASRAEGCIQSIYSGSLRCRDALKSPSFHGASFSISDAFYPHSFSGFLTWTLYVLNIFQSWEWTCQCSVARVQLEILGAVIVLLIPGWKGPVGLKTFPDSSFARPAAFEPLTSIQNFKTGDVTTQIETEHHPNCWKAMVGASHHCHEFYMPEVHWQDDI